MLDGWPPNERQGCSISAVCSRMCHSNSKLGDVSVFFPLPPSDKQLYIMYGKGKIKQFSNVNETLCICFNSFFF